MEASGGPAEVGGVLTRVRRPPWTRVSGTHVLAALAGILAFLTNLALLRGGEDVVLVAVASRDLLPGARYEDLAVRHVPLDAGSEVLPGLVTSAEEPALAGRVLTARVSKGDPVPESALAASSAPLRLRAVSIPVDRDRAVGGALGPGDRVDVIAVVDRVASYVLVGAEVLAVPASDEGRFGGTGGFHVVVAVDAEQALRLAEAMSAGSLNIVRSTGAADPVSDPDGLETPTRG